MTNAEIFSQTAILSHYGKRLDREKLAGTPAAIFYDFIAQQAEDLISSAKQSITRLPNIHFDFVHSGAVDAFACKVKDQYFIGITSGTIVLLQMILCRMLSDSLLLTHAGDPGGEASELPPLAKFVPDAQRMAEAGVKITLPKTKARWQYSCHLLFQATLFLIGHELAHITRGHVDYLNSTTGIPFFPEVGWNKPDPSGNIERQSLEGDADQRSLIARLESARFSVATPDRPVPLWLSATPKLEQLFFDCAFSASLLFRIFGDDRFAGKDLSADSYPPFPLRRAMLMIMAHSYTKEAVESSLQDVAATALRDANMGTELAFATITGESLSGVAMVDAFSPEGRAHMKLLEDCWNGGLRDRVAPFAYELI